MPITSIRSTTSIGVQRLALSTVLAVIVRAADHVDSGCPARRSLAGAAAQIVETLDVLSGGETA